MAIVTNEPKVIFFHIPKTAGTSITSWLKHAGKGKKNRGKHSDMYEHEDILKQDIFSFACVRHPYTLVPSAYYYMMRFNFFKKKNLSLEDWILNDGLLENICRKQQFKYLDMDRLDYLIKYENLTEDFEKIRKMFSRGRTLAIENAAMRDKEVHLTDNMKEKIYLHYKEDFSIFNYEY